METTVVNRDLSFFFGIRFEDSAIGKKRYFKALKAYFVGKKASARYFAAYCDGVSPVFSLKKVQNLG